MTGALSGQLLAVTQADRSYWIWLAAAAVLFGLLGGWISDRRQRPYWQGFLLGFAFGGFGVVAALFLLRRPRPPSAQPPGDSERLKAAVGAEEDEEDEEDEEAARCSSCGAPLAPEDRFCPTCGAKAE